jgi:hypothetical protein
MAETILGRVLPFGIFQVVHGESYFRGAGVPWIGLVVVVAISALFVQRAIVTIEGQDF